MKIGYHSANVIYRYDPCIILVQESCVSWEGMDWSGTGEVRTETRGSISTV